MIQDYYETISTNTIECIVGRTEMIDIIKSQRVDTKELVLISVSEPVLEHYADEQLTYEQVSTFKASLRCKFWDIEEKIGNYDVIDDETAEEIQTFILNHINDRFAIHCRAGVSRSAGIGLAIECIKYFGIGEEAKYNYLTSFNSEIKQHSRYHPNYAVFDKIVKEY